MTIGRICQREVDLADAEESVQAAAQRMNARNVGMLVVLDAERRPVGVLTDRDLALRVVAAGADATTLPVGEMMTADPATVGENTPIEDALTVMRKICVRRLPVVDDDGRLVGVVSLDDILELLTEEFGILGGILTRSSPRRIAE